MRCRLRVLLKSGFPRGFELLLMFALASADNRGKHLKFGALGKLQHLIDDLIDGLLLYLSAADRAVRNAIRAYISRR